MPSWTQWVIERQQVQDRDFLKRAKLLAHQFSLQTDRVFTQLCIIIWKYKPVERLPVGFHFRIDFRQQFFLPRAQELKHPLSFCTSDKAVNLRGLKFRQRQTSHTRDWTQLILLFRLTGLSCPAWKLDRSTTYQRLSRSELRIWMSKNLRRTLHRLSRFDQLRILYHFWIVT